MATLQKIRIINILSPSIEKERAMFLKRLGALLQEGYSIKNSLKFMSMFEKPQTKVWVSSLEKGLVQGNTLHVELEKIGYSNKICSQIYLASQSGAYAKTILQCGDDLFEQEKFKKRLWSLLSYPFILLSFLFLMLMLMRFLILPNMQNMFSSNKTETNIYADLLVALIYYSPQIMIVSVSLLAMIYFYLGKKLTHFTTLEKIRFFSNWPIIRKYSTNYWTNFIFLEWGQLLKKGISFHEIIAMMSEEEASSVLKETGELLSKEMLQGKTVKEALKILPFFEEEAFVVINHAENLGKLGSEMLIYASYCEQSLTEQLEKTLSKLQPLIFIFIALMIIAIYAAMILPIYTLMEGI